ncbi:MAG: type IX secretion system protein PorQ [Flavobacteriales bacterium]|nr:type IX secretion system protein PorQ [Flavobacteriales bacterium]
MRRKVQLFLFSIFICLNLEAQIGGSEDFIFLELPSAARQAGLGGNLISISDADINLAYSNPASLNEKHNDQISFNYNSYLAGIKYSNVAFAKHYKDLGTFSANVQYFNYGEFEELDEFGNQLGTFKPSEYMVSLGASRAIDSSFTVGAHLNYISSQLYTATASALAMDLGAHYQIQEQQLSMGFVLKNIGFALSDLSENEETEVPFEVQFGITKRLAKSPLRFSLTLENLQQWDLTYQDPSELNQIDPLTGEIIIIEDPSFLDKLMLHTVFGTEFLLGENMHFRFGYNYRRRQELKIDTKPGTAGFSWGFGLKVNKFHLNYGRGTYIVGQGTNQLSISTRLGYFKKK